MGEADLTTGKNRLAGYRRALEDKGIPIEPELIRIGSFSRQHGAKGTRELLQLAEPPTVIFAGSNRILMGTLFALREQGLRVPNDVSVVAFDDAEWLSVCTPPITAVDIAIEEMARLAVDLLQRRITSPKNQHKPVTYLLSTSLIERESCRRLSRPSSS